MPYEELYRAHALSGSLFQTVCIRKAALLIALDNDVRDQSDVEADLPNDGDFAHWMAPELEPCGRLKTSRDKFERALLRSLAEGHLSTAVVARTVDGEVDPLYTLVPIHEIHEWCQERDLDTGDWLQQHEEAEIEFSDAIIDDIVKFYIPGRVEPDSYDATAFEAYKKSEESEQADQYLRLLREVQKLRAESHNHKLDAEVSINTKEKNSLLTVIAALVNALNDSLPSGYKRAEAVARLTDQIGASVSVNTVDKILKQTGAAVDRRRDAYK
jgi:molecular chaperone GrpE (heat shock protein)